jgi:type III restriction enzyme
MAWQLLVGFTHRSNARRLATFAVWQVLNKVAYPQDARYGRHILVVAPGLTVKHRLQVLLPAGSDNYYDEFNIVPPGMDDKLRQGRLLVHNWHALLPLDPNAGPRVVKKGQESDEAFTRRVLEELATAPQLVVINDEAHHAWRLPPATTIRGINKEDLQQATQWIGGLDRLQYTRGISTCFDFSATPFIPSGKAAGEDALFDWITSDFSLNDAIEAGLVKTPRVVVRGDGPLSTKYRSRLYHIYADPDVKDDLNRPARPQEPLPDLVINGYYLLGLDWLETARHWQAVGAATPPVMITVANRTETAARVNHAFTHGQIGIKELQSPDRTLHIDSRVLAKAELREDAPEARAEPAGDEDAAEEGTPTAGTLPKLDPAEALRRAVDTVGQVGKPGEQIQNVISVGMLSEGWDARTVTHVMGLRAFTSQLLCEQVIGRGLRRTSYDVDPVSGLFEPEYVNVFGVPFTFLPHEGGEGTPPAPPSPKARIEPDGKKAQYAITWPNVVHVDHQYRPRLSLDPSRLPPLVLNAADVTVLAELAPVIEGKPDISQIREIDLLTLGRRFRTQQIVFATASNVFDQIQPDWQGSREQLLAQLVRLVEQIVTSDRVTIHPALYDRDPLRRRIVLTMNMSRLVQHIWQAIRFENAEALAPVFDTEHPLRSTADMRPWATSKPCNVTEHSHINMCVYDSTWEATEAGQLDRSPHVVAWVKNDHLGFEVLYTHRGVVHKYLPDFLVRLADGRMLILEVKGQDDDEQRTKRQFLDEWVRAVNSHGGFGEWSWAVSRQPLDVLDILEQHCARARP